MLGVEEDEQRGERDHAEGEAADAADDRREGKDDLRELDLLDDPFLRRHRGDAVADAGAEPLPGQDRAEDEEGIALGPVADDDRDEDDVNGHLEERIEDPPDIAEEGVRAFLCEVRPDQVADQPLARSDLAEGLDNEAERPPPDTPNRGPDFLNGLHWRER